MQCSLCLEDKPLQKSHIVPEFFYRAMYDEKGRFFGLRSSPQASVKLFQKGLRERLLCWDCEQHLGKYEHYASSVIYQQGLKGRPYKELIVFKDLDYTRLKIFFLSLLWRFSVTSIEGFKGAKLGPHAEKLRVMIHAGDPGMELTYPFLFYAVVIDRKHISDLIVPPSESYVDHQRAYTIVVGGFMLVFFIGSHPPPAPFHPFFLKSDGTFTMHIKELTDIPFLLKFACEMAATHRAHQKKNPRSSSTPRTSADK